LRSITKESVGIGKGDGLGPEFGEFLDGVLRDIAGTGDGAGLALETVALDREHVVREIDAAVAGRFGTDERSAVRQALACQDAGKLVRETLVLAEHVADLASADADVARGDVGIRADVAVQLAHEALAEAHHFAVGLAVRVEVAAAFSAAHGKRGEAVLENLLEAEEFQD